LIQKKIQPFGQVSLTKAFSTGLPGMRDASIASTRRGTISRCLNTSLPVRTGLIYGRVLLKAPHPVIARMRSAYGIHLIRAPYPRFFDRVLG